jgi:hypothetical protein
MPKTAPTSAEYPHTLAAVTAMQAGADQWVLADALLKEVGVGEPRVKFHAVNEALVRAGLKAKHVDSLRFARDTAAAWPPHTRITGVSFTAHRELRFFEDREAILAALVAQYGLKVSVSIVNAELVARGLSKRTTNMSSQVAVLTNAPTAAQAVQIVNTLDALKAATPDALLRAYYDHHLAHDAATVADQVLGTLSDPAGRTVVTQVVKHLGTIMETWGKADKLAQDMANKAAKKDTPAKAAPGKPGAQRKQRVGDMRGLD